MKMSMVTAWPKRLRKFEFTRGALRKWKRASVKRTRNESKKIERETPRA